ncbi:hypothetical protein E3N88_33382 [Mikania micrantha]|uniref:Uncharacterized protein n=1 Tax=Mikania micrantha TaxID=192012 RepID=A0A5N6MCH2_9ASTR|nr:hypothetical protein E3N88_33382 [Mikania micrantha]
MFLRLFKRSKSPLLWPRTTLSRPPIFAPFTPQWSPASEFASYCGRGNGGSLIPEYNAIVIVAPTCHKTAKSSRHRNLQVPIRVKRSTNPQARSRSIKCLKRSKSVAMRVGGTVCWLVSGDLVNDACWTIWVTDTRQTIILYGSQACASDGSAVMQKGCQVSGVRVSSGSMACTRRGQHCA